MPGKGLAQHDFLYAGESKNRRVFIVRKGEVVWKVCEYDTTGKEVWSFPTDNPWGVTPLKNGNVLIVDRRAVREVTPKGESVATFTPADSPGYKLTSLQLAWRLPNGNTLVNNWFYEWNGQVDKAIPPVQAVEFTPDKKIVWVLRSWENPDLGPATTIQILDEASVPEAVTFGDIK